MADLNNKYVLEGSHAEVERLQKQHLWFQNSLKGQIVFAPIDLQKNGLRILDIGCADGTLLRDLQKVVPTDAELVGLDVSESFLPKSAQGNIHYMFGDVTQPFPVELQGGFDLTHLRYTLVGTGSISVEKVVSDIAATLKPGGWLQIQEPDLRSETWAGQKSTIADFVEILGTFLDKIGAGRAYTGYLEGAFRKAGLDNVSVRKVVYPLGAKAASDQDAKTSVESFRNTIETALSSTKALGIEYPQAVGDHLKERFETEMSEKGGEYHGLIVIGQKKAA